MAASQNAHPEHFAPRKARERQNLCRTKNRLDEHSVRKKKPMGCVEFPRIISTANAGRYIL